MDFEEWFESRDDIGCLIGLEGYAAKEAWNARQAELKKAVLSLRNEFNLWADDTEQFHAIEAQIEQLEELLK